MKTRLDLQGTATDVLDGIAEHRLLTYASAIAYQIISSVIPFALFALALAGVVGATGLWTDRLRPELLKSASPEVFAVLDKTVGQVLQHKAVFWVTFGLVLLLWEVGGAVRATMEALDDVYATKQTRSRTDKYVTSTWLAGVVGLLWLGAFVTIIGGEAVVGGPAGIVPRYLVAGLLLMLATGLMIRIGPTERPPVKWVSVGSAVIVVGSLLVVGGYILYATSIASYGSVFGSLAAVFVLIVAVYLAAVVFLVGVLIDAKARDAS